MKRLQLLKQCISLILEMVGVDTKTLGDLQNVLKGDFEIHGPNGVVFKSRDLRDKCILVKAEKCKQRKRLEDKIKNDVETFYRRNKDELEYVEVARKYKERTGGNYTEENRKNRHRVVAQDFPKSSTLYILFLRIAFYILREKLKIEGASPAAFEEQFNVDRATMSNGKKYEEVKRRCQEGGDLKAFADKFMHELECIISVIKEAE